MDFNPATLRRRETVVLIALSLLFGGGIFLFALLVFGEFLIAMLLTVER